MERSNFLKFRDKLVMKNPTVNFYLGETCMLGEEAYELLSLKHVLTPV
jgi:hypothetical protein